MNLIQRYKMRGALLVYTQDVGGTQFLLPLIKILANEAKKKFDIVLLSHLFLRIVRVDRVD